MVSSNDSYIDPRDVEQEAEEFESSIEEIQEQINDIEEELEEAREGDDEELIADLDSRLSSLESELDELKDESENIIALRDDCNSYAGGSTLISEIVFVEYVQELASDTGDIDQNSWLYQYIDWEQAAEDCKMDYTTITFEGTDFYVHD